MVIQHIKTLIAAGWSQGRIAKESGIAQPSINRLLNGRQSDVHYAQGKKLEELAAKVGAGDTTIKDAA
jgi:transcriptional regulator with XRE-family HTH domain